jgi:hypothetical protein
LIFSFASSFGESRKGSLHRFVARPTAPRRETHVHLLPRS